MYVTFRRRDRRYHIDHCPVGPEVVVQNIYEYFSDDIRCVQSHDHISPTCGVSVWMPYDNNDFAQKLSILPCSCVISYRENERSNKYVLMNCLCGEIY